MTIVLASADDDATRWNGQGKVGIAPGGVAGVFLYDGSSSWSLYKSDTPYTTTPWSLVTVVTNAILPGSLAAVMDRTTGDFHVVYKKSGGPLPHYRKFTFGSGTWTMGSEVQVETTGDFANDAAAAHITLDLSGRIWIQMSEWVGGYARHLYYSSNGTTWTDYYAGGTVSQNGSAAHIQPCFNGATQYILTTYQSGGDIRWRRAQTSGGSVGAISSEGSTNFTLHDDHSSDMLMLPDGRVLLTAAPQSGNEYAIRSLIYDPATDTWAYSTGTQSTSDIGSAVQDRWPCLALNDKTGTVYCFWNKYNGTDDYSVVYREFDPYSNTWGALVTMQGPGDKYSLGAGYSDGGDLMTVQSGGYFSIGPWVEAFTEHVNDNEAALTFDGSGDYATHAHDSLLNLGAGSGSFTIEAWCRDATGFNHGGQYFLAKCQYDWQPNEQPYALGRQYNNYTFAYRVAGTTEFSDMDIGNSSEARWRHIAWVWDHPAMSLSGYLDGVLTYGPTVKAVAPAGNTEALWVGVRASDLGQAWIGDLDELRMWNVIRTGTEIAAYKNTRATGSETGLVACYGFDEGSGTTIADRTANNLDLTITGATWRTSRMPALIDAVGGGPPPGPSGGTYTLLANPFRPLRRGVMG